MQLQARFRTTGPNPQETLTRLVALIVPLTVCCVLLPGPTRAVTSEQSEQPQIQSSPYFSYTRAGTAEPWFVPGDRLAEYLKLDLPRYQSSGIEVLLAKSCDYQELGPKDSPLCFREPRPYQTQLQKYEEELERLKAEDSRTGQDRTVVHTLEKRLEALRSEVVVVNPCSGVAMYPESPRVSDPAKRLDQGFVLLGRVVEVKAGWKIFSAELGSMVRVSVERVLHSPQSLPVPGEVSFLEPRARFAVGALEVCSGLGAAVSEPGALVLIQASGWSDTGQELDGHVVFEIRDGLIVRDILGGGSFAEPIDLTSLTLSAAGPR